MPQHQIFIESINADGTLELSDRGRNTFVSGGDRVSWHIRPHSGVANITRILKKSSSPEIFSNPPQQQGSIWKGDIMSNPTPDTEWVYSIFWKANGSNEKEFDPKISVLPSI
jgi:hypothetical protein